MKEFIWKIFGMPQKYYIWAPEADIWIRVSKSFFYKLRVGDIISITYIYERVANGWDLARWIKNRSEIIRKMSGLSDFEIKVLDIYYESPIILFAYWGDHRIVAELKRTDRV